MDKDNPQRSPVKVIAQKSDGHYVYREEKQMTVSMTFTKQDIVAIKTSNMHINQSIGVMEQAVNDMRDLLSSALDKKETEGGNISDSLSDYGTH